jgi:hypothetical protein
MESVLYIGPLGGGIETEFNLLPKGALDGELEFCCRPLEGDCLLGPWCGGLSMIFLPCAFFIGRNGENFLELEAFFDEGIGA